MNTGSIVRSWLLGGICMSVSVSEKIALGGYPMQTTVRCLLLRVFWLTAQFARMYLKRRVVRMAKFISKSQMEELEDACTFGIEGANKLLKKYAGIQARAYTAYNYYDENDNFLANSDETDLDDLLGKANVEVRHGG